MGTKEVRVTLSESKHNELSNQKDGHTWREVLEAGCQTLSEDSE